MRKIGKFGLTAIAVAILVPAQDASALTLGRVRGAALIGRPLSVTIPVTLEPGDSDPCVQADVFQGDARMDRSGARVERSADGSFQVRVTSALPVEEPVVTLFLRVGCSQPMTRRYVLLSEYQDDAQQPPTPAFRAPAATSVQAVPAPRTAEAPLVLRPAPPQRAPGAAPSRRPPAPAVAAAPPAPDRSPKRAAPAPAPRGKPGREVLRVEPLDLSIDYAPALKGTTELQSTPSEGAKRAEAAALWAALNLPPEELIRQTRRIEVMETEVKSLKDAVQRNSSVVNALGQQLEKARAERNVVTMALLALLALAAGAGGFLLWRRRRGAEGGSGMRWWARQDPPDSAFEPVQPAAVAAKAAGPVSASAPSAPAAQGKAAEPRRRPVLPDEVVTPSSFSRLQRESGEPEADPRHQFVHSSDFSASQPGSMRSVKAEELIDIQQQAEFFVSIGQHQQALALLESHVHDHVETSPVAWLDLLELYHALGERDDYERIRAEFHALFNAQVPDFESYRTQSGGLEEYRRALSRIVALWPSPRVLSLIEDSIFRKPGTPGAEPFDLAAYRDLLLLYNVAKDIVRDEGSPNRSAPMSMLNEMDRESESGRMGFLDSRPFESLPRANEDPWDLRTSPHIEEDVPTPMLPEGGVDIDLEALEPPGDELGPLVGGSDANGEPLSAEDRDSMISFDFELLPSQGKPSDTSRR